MKYCSTVRPSRKFAVIGVSMISPDGLAIRPRMPASCRICCGAAAGARVGHHEDRVEARRRCCSCPRRPSTVVGAELAQHLVGDAVGDLGPDVDDLVVALAVGDQTLVVLVLDLAHLAVRPRSSSLRFCGGITMSLMAIEMPALVAYS